MTDLFPHEIKQVGLTLHQISLERSIQEGRDGRGHVASMGETRSAHKIFM